MVYKKREQEVIDRLRTRGERITPARRALIALFARRAAPLTVPEIRTALMRKKILANKSTFYREVAFLEKHKIIREVRLDSNKRRYEFAPLPHHHHIVCTVCKKVQDIPLTKALARMERAIARTTRFAIRDHSIEFFGTCTACTRT